MKCLISNNSNINFEFKETALKLAENGSPNFNLIFSEGTQMSILKKDKGLQFLATILGLLITDFQKSVNLIRPLNDEQIANISIDLINNYWSYKFEDFVAFFQLAKKGVYGKIYDRLDDNIIYSMLIIYDEKRVDELRASQIKLQESKENLSPFASYDREAQNNWFNDKSAQIGDYIQRLKKIET